MFYGGKHLTENDWHLSLTFSHAIQWFIYLHCISLLLCLTYVPVSLFHFTDVYVFNLTIDYLFLLSLMTQIVINLLFSNRLFLLIKPKPTYLPQMANAFGHWMPGHFKMSDFSLVLWFWLISWQLTLNFLLIFSTDSQWFLRFIRINFL